MPYLIHRRVAGCAARAVAVGVGFFVPTTVKQAPAIAWVVRLVNRYCRPAELTEPGAEVRLQRDPPLRVTRGGGRSDPLLTADPTGVPRGLGDLCRYPRWATQRTHGARGYGAESGICDDFHAGGRSRRVAVLHRAIWTS